jgi:hypothetical protein
MSRSVNYRGLIADGEQQIIPLQTNNGLTGYKIKKFQIMPYNFNESDEYTVQIWKTSPPAIATNQDFSDQRLLAVAYFATDGTDIVNDSIVIFDSEKFNQNVFVVCKTQSGKNINYYIEMEQMKLSLDEQTVATLKDIRNTGTQ